ncbi:hypothetical protein CRM22_001262 [Opisthorchis felineus]|uniref:UBA domain-containing protein n=1 Tax=Opisthorchis felineus TaxID=147828 RepID=A0A4S2MBG7_OPIFE|nr:hypothetical protein CRM22_001262 [Opisthorchis felineus]
MLRKVIAGLIERVIGSYVEDVNGEKLSIGLLNGNLALNQLTLKSDTLHRLLGIPLVLDKGTIGRVSVHIPYTHIWSQPWQLCIEDVELIAYPSASELYTQQTRAMEGSTDYQPADSTQAPTDTSSFDQKYYLAQMEEKWWKTIHSTGVNDATALAAAVAMGSDADASSWLSYLASFGYAVVRSIQIEIHNVHLRIVQHASPTDLLIMPESLFGAFTISLEHLTVKSADVGNQETNAESKLIKMDNFCVKWSEVVSRGIGRPSSSTTDMQLADDKLLYVLPPSSLTGQLKRSRMHESASTGSSPHLVVDRSFRNRLVQLEFDTGLGDLKLQLSRDLCKASVHLAELVTLEQHRMEQFARRPKVPVRLNATKWWKYIAGEIRPRLRPLFNSTLRINLVELAAEARSNLLYVDAYTNYLVRGLTILYQPSSANQPVESDCPLQSESDVADHFRRHVADEQWPVGRIAALRLVAMRRAASVLHEFVKPQRLKQSAGGSSHSGSPCPIEGGNHHHQQQLERQQTSVSASPGAMSWYAWWRYSSLLGIRTLWYGPEVTEGIKPSLSQPDETGSSRSRTVADSPPTVKQAIFELLDELALSSDPLGEAKSPGCVPEGDLIAFRLVCRVVGCSVRLVENDFQFSLASNFVHPAFISVCGESMQFTVEAEPWQRSLRFAASVESFMVRDERHLMVSTTSTNLDHSQSRPTFPFVVFPRVSKVESSSSRFPSDEAIEQTQSSGLLWLVYEVRPPGSSFDYSLKIKTDPLHVVYQPELIHCVVDFLQTVASAASLDLESSARLHYEVIKQRTQANIRAILDETSKPNGFTDTTFLPRSESGASPSTSSFQPAVKKKRPRRWHLQLDISAPRLLLPNRFSEVTEGSDVRRQPVIGLLCNFGHLRVSNWPLAETERVTDWAPEDCATTSPWSAKDEDDLFLTPCGTPDNQSDAELDELDAEPRTIFVSGPSDGATCHPAFPQVNLYQSFVVHLDELHVLVGPLNMLKKLQLWTNPEDSCLPSDKGSHTPTDCTDFEQEVLSPTSSRLLQQLSIVDRISLRLLVSRRVITYSELVRRYKTLADQTGEYPPSLWITLEQERCVLQLSDSKINNLLNCLRPKHDVPRQCTTESKQVAKSTSLSAAHSGRPEGLSWSPLSRSRTRSAVTPRSNQTLNDRWTCFSFSTQRKRLIATFSVAELIVQLENRGYPTAEFRLEGFAGTWIRLTGRGAGYQGRIQLRNFSIADAVTNLGGEYDLLLAAHKDVRLNDYGQLEVRSTSSVAPSETPVDPVQNAIHPLVQPPEGHVPPILEFSDPQDLNSHFIRLYFDWIPRAAAGDMDSHVTPRSQIAGARTVRLHLHCLDVVFNPTTLGEIYNCVHYLTSLSEIFPGSSRPADEPSCASSSFTLPAAIQVVTRLTVDRCSVLVIRVIQPTPTTDEAICHGNVCRAERIVLTTLDKIDICSESDLCSRTMSFRLNGLRVLDLTQTSLRYRYLLTAGIVPKSVGTSSASATERSNSPVFLNMNWPTLHAEHTKGLPSEFSLFLPHFTYVHSASTIEQLISWTQTLPTWRIDTKVVPPWAFSEMSRYLFSISVCCEIVQPVLVIPDRTASSSRALIARLQNVHLLNPDCPSLCPNRLTTCTTNRVCTRFDSAELLFVEFAKFPALHISSPVLVERMLRFYRSVTCPSSGGQSSGAEQILAPISGSVWLSSPISGFHLPRWYSSLTVRPSDLFPDSPPESLDPSFSSDQPSSSANNLELFLLEVKVERAVRIYLTKPVCLHLSRFLLSVSSLRTQFGSTGGSLELPSSDSPKNRISFCLSLPHLQLDTMADLDINPVPLACLKLNDLVVKLTQASNATPHLSSCGELFARDVVLCDMLPVENGSTPNVDPILLSVLPENPESGAVSKATSNITASCPDLTSNWDRGSKKHNISVSSCSHAISNDQLAMCEACSAYGTFADSLQLLHTAALRIQLLMLSNLIDSGVPKKFSQAKRMIHVQCKQVFSRLRPQPWVLLLDFLNFSSPDDSSFDTRLRSSLNLSEQILSTNATASRISEPTLISINADGFEVVLTTTSCDDPTPCDLAKFSGHTACLCLLDLVDQLEPYLPVDRQFTPDNLPGPYLFMEGGLGDLVITTNSANDCSLYNERFRIRSPAELQAPSVGSTLLFRLLRSLTPSPGNLEINGYFWARIAPSIYVHIQPFVVTLLESIIELFDLRDMFSRARKSAEGQMINTQAPTSPVFLLDIVLSDPRFVVPVSSHSPEALVVVMDRLMVKTSCLCTHDEVDFVSPIDESRRYQPHCFQRLPVSDPLFQCRCCSANSVSQESSSPQSTTSTKFSFRSSHCSDDVRDTVDAEIGNCVLERIHLDLSNAVIYHGVHCSMAGHVEPEPMASNPIVPSDTLVQCLYFSDYSVTPGQQPNRLRRTLFDSKSMQFRLERNLHSARSHHVPDWRLVTPLTDVQIYLNEHIYSVVRGLLSHNFGGAGARKDKTEPSSETSLLDRFKLPQLCALRHPSYYPPKAGLQTAITGIPWTVFSFEIPMENIRFLCFDNANGSSGSGEHSRIDFRLACFSFDALSDRRVFVGLQCSKVRFVDPQMNKAIIAPVDPLLPDGVQSRGSRPNLMTPPLVYCFWLQYIMDHGSMALWLHLDRMRILYHHNAFSRFTSFLKSSPSSKCSVDPPHLGSSQSSFAYQLCAENSELELVGPRDSGKSSAILLQGTVLLAYSDLNGVWKTTVPCAHLCLHTVSLHLTCDRRAHHRGKCIVNLQSARLDLSHDQPIHSTSQQSLPSVRRQCSQPMSLSNSVATGRLWRVELVMPLERNENTQRRPFTVATWIQRMDSLADWISPFVHDIKIHTGFSLRILRAELGYLVPIFNALLPRLTLTWCREETSPIGVLKVDGLALNYFNRDLVAWEPALEPWSCSLEWYQILTDSFTKTSTVIFTSSETLNLNLTVPLCLLVRRLLETTQQDSPGCDVTPVSSTATSVSNEATGPDDPTNAAPFRLLNRTGCIVSFKVLPMNQIDGVFQNEGSLEELESRPWYHVGSAQEIVDIPCLTTESEKSQDSSVLPLTNPPSLLFRVAGWKPTYPISVDRLGIYFRTLERNDLEEDIDEDKVFTLTDYLPQFTRLVIEVVRTGPSVQHVIVLRSGLTITNDLADGHQLLVGLQPPTAPPQSVPEDVWSSQLDDANLPIQRIPVCLIDSGDTAAVPLNLAAVLSTGFGVLSFCPTLIPIGPGRNMSSVFSQMTGPSFAAYGWAGVSLPGATPATQSETATGVVTSSSLPELSEIEVAKHLDWTSLKQPGELIETILVCRSSTATGQVGLLSATLDSAATPVSSSSTSAPISYHRTQSIPRQYNMCLAMVRDNFPPDPLWTGLLSTSNRANPKCLPGHHITVGPIVRITNLLPCELVYYFSGTMVKGSISAGADACVNELSPAEVLRFGIHLDGFPKCEPLTIPPNTYDQKVLLRLQDTLGRPLELQIQVLARAGSAKHLTVSAAFWLINQSGLPLIFVQSSSSPGRLYTSNSEAARQRALTNIAAGQYDEHEEARSVSPLLFSFSNRNEGYLLRVRVGRGLSKTESADPANPNGGFYPVWSPAISLDKSGVDMLQLKMVDSTNRPSLVYHVGFEVREGCGRHAVTRIVTFKPRYVIENATDLRLQVAQRKCLRTRSGASAIAVLDSGGTQAYHWPREDLDRLLCVRAVWEVTNPEQRDDPIDSERHSSWSGGFPIDRPYSFTMMLHLPHISEPINSGVPQDSISDTTNCPVVDRLFLRVVLVLRAATFHILLSDASSLPAPFRIENDSAVSLSYQQVLRTTTSLRSVITEPAAFSPVLSDGTSPSMHRRSDESLESVSSTDAAGGQEKSEWIWGATLSYIGPATSVDYAVEEPLCNPVVTLRVQGGTSAAYDLDKIGLGGPLIYDNFVYLTVLGPLMDTAVSSRCDSFSSDFVFDVRPSSHHVVYSSKIPGRRAQLWWLSDSGHIFHEGSSSPLEPGERSNLKPVLYKKQFVLDVDIGSDAARHDENRFVLDTDTIRQFEVARLVVSPLNKRRKNFQTWRIDQHGLLVNNALYCVQVYRETTPSHAGFSDFVGAPILAVKPRPSATRLLSPSLAPAIILPLWLRPGSGRLRVYVYLDGVTRVLRIEDEAFPSRLLPSKPNTGSSSKQSAADLSRWGSLMLVDATPKRSSIIENSGWDNSPSNRILTETHDCSQFRVLVSLPLGIGLSVVSAFAEELVYASLVNVRLSFCRAYSLDVFDKDWERFAESASPPPSGGLNVACDVLQLDACSTPTTREPTPEVTQGSWTNEETDALASLLRRKALSDYVRFSVDHVQVNSQFPGATLPVLLFTDSTSLARGSSATNRIATDVLQGKPLALTAPGEFGGIAHFSPASTLSVAYQRQVQSRWNVHLFKTFQVTVGPVYIQAEELLLLKLIQFWQHATSRLSTSNITSDYGDEQPLFRPNFSSGVDKSSPFWFDTLSISFIPLKLSVQTAKKSLTSSNLAGAKRLLPSLMSFSNAEVNLEPLLRSHVLGTSSYLIEQVVKHYKLQLRAHAINIFGSVDFLGNPLGFINDMTSGISGLVELDVGSLIRHVAHGVGDSAAKVAGSVSHLLNAISLDEEHQHERAAILGVRAEASPLLEPNRSSQTSLDAFGSDSASYSSDYGADPLEGFELAQVSDLVPGIPIQSGETFAPLAAGVRGLVHGFVGGLTSMVTQPYKGIQEDQFKGFVTGFGRGLLGTVTKPLGGILDLVSGVMTTISEATRFSSNVQPRRRRPRRSGLSKYALLPLTVYHLDESVAQLQLHRLTLFTSARSAPKSSRRYTSPPSVTSTEWLEIGEEVAVELEDSCAHPVESKEVIHALQSVSYAIHSTVDGAWLSHRFNYPECVFYVLPVQEAGVVAILTDRAIWCVSSQSLRGFVSSWPTDPTIPFERLPGPIFPLTEHATLMFMLPYHRLDHVRVKRSDFSLSHSSSTSESVYVIFTGDSGVSAQQLRCDHTSWAVQLTKRTRETQFRFLQAAFSLFRPDLTLTPTAVNANPTGRSIRHGGVPLVPGYPVALAYAPVYR